MNSPHRDSEKGQDLPRADLEALPRSFEEAVTRVKHFVLREFEQEIAQKQLYYHNFDHVNAVQRRADQIFKALRPHWEASLEIDTASEYLHRMKLLLDLCAIAHDMVQQFVPKTQPNTSRKREGGVSEAATITKLLDYIHDLNRQVRTQNPNSLALFTDSDLQIIREAIESTVCLYDPTDRSIYQPALYNSDRDFSWVARILALADIGALGMDGIEAYKKEGSLIFLEENIDTISMILNRKANPLYFNSKENQSLQEKLKQRLLKRARFQINFAKSRIDRLSKELEGFPPNSIYILTHDLFKYLNSATLQKLELLTPIDENSSLDELLDLFALDQYI